MRYTTLWLMVVILTMVFIPPVIADHYLLGISPFEADIEIGDNSSLVFLNGGYSSQNGIVITQIEMNNQPTILLSNVSTLQLSASSPGSVYNIYFLTNITEYSAFSNYNFTIYYSNYCNQQVGVLETAFTLRNASVELPEEEVYTTQITTTCPDPHSVVTTPAPSSMDEGEEDTPIEAEEAPLGSSMGLYLLILFIPGVLRYYNRKM